MTVSTDESTNILATISNPYPNGYNLPLGSAEAPTGGSKTNSFGLGIGESFFSDYVNPIIQQWNANIQRELPAGWLIETAYLGSKGNHLPDGEGSIQYDQLNPSILNTPDRDRLIPNASNLVANPFFGVITNPASTLRLATVQYGQLLRPYPQYTGIGAFRKPSGNSIYHSFTLRLEKRFSHGLSMLFSYTASKLIDDVSQQVNFCWEPLPAMPEAGLLQPRSETFHLGAGRVAAASHQRQLRPSVWPQPDVPQPRAQGGGLHPGRMAGKRDRRPSSTGTPIQIGNGQNALNIFSANQRASATGADPYMGGAVSDRLTHYFNQSAFVQSGNFVIGTLGRFLPNIRGIGQNNIDASIFKNFSCEGEAAGAVPWRGIQPD